MFKQVSVSASSKTSVWVRRIWVAAAALILTGMYSLTAHGDHEVIVTQEGNLECVTVTFEGGVQSQDIHGGDPIPGAGISFPSSLPLPSWVTLTSGQYSNNPSGVTVAVPVAGPSFPLITDFDVFFVDPVQTVSFDYSSLSDITVTAFDANDNAVGSDSGLLTNLNFDLTVWIPLSVDAGSSVITRIVVTAHRGSTLIDDFKTCRSLDPAALLEELINDVMALNLHQGMENSLDAKLEAILRALEDMNQNNFVAVCNKLQAFINEVQAQSGKKIPESDADALIASALKITDLLDCNEG